MDPSISRPYAERVLSAAMKRRGLDRIALSALRKATELLGLAIGTRLAQMREHGSPVQALLSQTEQDALHLRLLQETVDILAARWDKVPDQHRPHYTPEQRYRILRLRDLSPSPARKRPGPSESPKPRSSGGKVKRTHIRTPLPLARWSDRFHPSAATRTSSATWSGPWPSAASAATT